jgi:RNA recognition motif-containing protein
MVKTLYVGNLPYSTSEDDLKDLFVQYGEVNSAKIITDRETGRSRGFGFVEMATDGVEDAISALDGKEFGGRSLRVNEARERKPRRF